MRGKGRRQKAEAFFFLGNTRLSINRRRIASLLDDAYLVQSGQMVCNLAPPAPCYHAMSNPSFLPFASSARLSEAHTVQSGI